MSLHLVVNHSLNFQLTVVEIFIAPFVFLGRPVCCILGFTTSSLGLVAHSGFPSLFNLSTDLYQRRAYPQSSRLVLYFASLSSGQIITNYVSQQLPGETALEFFQLTNSILKFSHIQCLYILLLLTEKPFIYMETSPLPMKAAKLQAFSL